METRRSLVLRPFVLPWIGWEIFPPAHLAMKDKPFQ
jgi:hypothetical protein